MIAIFARRLNAEFPFWSWANAIQLSRVRFLSGWGESPSGMQNAPASVLPRSFKFSPWKNLRALALLIWVTAISGGFLHAQAVYFTWSDGDHVNGNDNVSDGLNWVGNAAPSASQSDLLNLTFGNGTAPQAVVNLDTSATLNSITFSDNIGYGINTSNGSTITLTGGTSGGVVSGITNNTTGSAGLLITVPLILQAGITVTNTPTATAGLVMSGNISGNGTVTITNNGTQPLQFTGVDNRSSGSTIITAGTFTVGDGTSTTAVLNGNVSDSGTLTFLMGPGVNHTYAGVISGTGGFTLGGSNTAVLILSGANTYSGSTIVSNGTLQDYSAGVFSANSSMQVGSNGGLLVNHNETVGGLKDGPGGGGAVTVASGATLTVNTTGVAGSYSGAIGGSGALVTGGTGTATFTGASTYSGGTTVSSGTLVVNNSTGSATGSGGVTINSGGTLQMGAVGGGTNGAISGSVTDNGTLSFGDTNTLGNTITGTGVVTVLNGGAATLTGNSNTYSGGTTINSGGTLYAGNTSGSATGTGTVTVNSSGTLVLGTFSGSATGSVSGSIVDNGTVRFNLTGNANFGNAVSGTGGVFDTQSGIITFTGTNKTYSGFTTVATGATLADAMDWAFSANSTVAVATGANLQVGYNETLSGLIGSSSLGGTVTIASGKTLTLNAGGFTDEYQGIITGAGAVAVSSTTGKEIFIGANTYAGGTTINSGSVLQLGDGTTNGSVTGSITDTGTLGFNLAGNASLGNAVSGTGGLNVVGTGTLTFSGANKTYSGQTNVSAGTIADSVSGDFSPNSIIALSSTGGVNVNSNESIAGLTGSSSVGVAIGSTATLTLSSSASSSDLYSGVISGVGALNKSGSGTFTEILSGANTYSGGTTVNGGTLIITNTTGSGIGTGGATIGTSGTLQLGSASTTTSGSVTGAIIDNGIFNIDLTVNNSLANAISGTGNVRLIQPSTLTFTGTNKTYSGNTFIGPSGGTIADANAGAYSPNSTMKLSTGTTLDVNYNETVAGLIGNSGTAGNVSLASGVNLIVNNAAANTFQGVISGSTGSLTIGGAGSSVFTGANTYGGGSTINSGATLQIGDGSTTNSSIGGAIVDNGTLTLDEDSSANVAFANAISGTGAVSVLTGGTITLPNANTYSGGTTIYSGTVILTNSTGSALGSGPVTLTSSTPSSIGSGGALIANNSITGALTIGGGGKLFPGMFNSGASTFTPGTFSAPSATLAGNGLLYFFINNTTGTAGTNWSLLNISGALNITASNSAQFGISINSVTAGNLAGSVINFNPAQSYSWMIASASGGITGFASNAFITTTANFGSNPGFANSLGTGSFFVSQSGNNLFLNFAPVPEPSTWCLLLAGTVLLGTGALRRRRK
jgi:fibronectin-binding autotransporter adhesin